MEGPPLWRNAVINLRSVIADVVLPAAAGTQVAQLGVDYIPPLNARADIVAPVRLDSQTQSIVESSIGSLDYLPESFSWNNVTSVRTIKQWNVTRVPILSPPSQYACGACWAFAITSALADRYTIAEQRPTPLELSPSFVLACIPQRSGCNGGFPADGGRFLETEGTVEARCYDYSWCTSDAQCMHANGAAVSEDLSKLVPACGAASCAHSCRGSACAHSGTTRRYRALPGSTQALVDQRSIQLDILQHGPVAAVCRIYGGFVAGSMSKAVYPQADGWARTRGVYVHVTGRDIYGYGKIDCLGANQNATDCFMGNHAMVIVGWGVERDVPNFFDPRGAPLDLPYWVVRNSWGTTWNGDGYCKIAMSNADLGINTEVALDRPLRIDGRNFGAVTTLLPDVPYTNARTVVTRRQTFPVAKTASANTWIDWRVVAVVAGVIVVLALFYGAVVNGKAKSSLRRSKVGPG